MRAKLSHHWFRLLGISVVLIVSWGVSWMRSPAGQEAKKGSRAIGGIYPRISENGETIVFSYQGAIWRIPRQGGTMRRLTTMAGFDIEPAWSHDGKRIAYVNSTNGELKLIDAESGAPEQLPTKVRAAGRLYFHPDNRRVLANFHLGTDRRQPQFLAWLDLEKGALTPVLEPSRPAEVHGLAPDGERLAFVSTQDVQGEQDGHNGPQADIWIVPARGGEA